MSVVSHLAADGRVLDGREGGGEAAVDPALLEVPQGRDDQMIFPGRSKPILCPARLKLKFQVTT